MTFSAHELEEERIAAEIARTNQERDTEPCDEHEPMELDAAYDGFASVRMFETLLAEFSAVADTEPAPKMEGR